MNLNEAKKILNDNGYKVELNEDLRKAWDEVKDSVSDALVGGMRKLSPKVQQFIQDTIPLGAALKEAGAIYGFRVEKEEGFYKLTVRNKHTSTAPDFLYVKGFRGNIEVNIDGEGWTTKTIKVHSKKELMDLLKIVIYSVDYEQPEAAAKGWFKIPQNESTITEAKQELIKHGYIILKVCNMNLNEALDTLQNAGYLVESYEDRADEIINKYCGSNGTLEEIENNIEKELGKKPKVSTDHINQVIWIETDEFTIIGYYQFDEDTGETYVNPQTVEFPNDEQDYIDDPVYGKDANR